jgi:hypothetical protein
MLNQEAINERRISIEDAEIKQYRPGVWQCHFCMKRFSIEAAFMRHHCEQKRRAQEIRSPAGQAGLIFYNQWLKHKKFKEQQADAFMASKYYRSFLKFAEMVPVAGISRPDRYVQLMVDAGITPDLWCRDACYKIYLDWMDKQEDPLVQVQSSIECLMDAAEKEGVDYRQIVSHLGSQKILSLISQRKLSPWFLLHSSSVQTMLKALPREELKAFDKAINIGAWVDRLSEHQHLRADIRHIITEVGL